MLKHRIYGAQFLKFLQEIFRIWMRKLISSDLKKLFLRIWVVLGQVSQFWLFQLFMKLRLEVSATRAFLLSQFSKFSMFKSFSRFLYCCLLIQFFELEYADGNYLMETNGREIAYGRLVILRSFYFTSSEIWLKKIILFYLLLQIFNIRLGYFHPSHTLFYRKIRKRGSKTQPEMKWFNIGKRRRNWNLLDPFSDGRYFSFVLIGLRFTI